MSSFQCVIIYIELYVLDFLGKIYIKDDTQFIIPNYFTGDAALLEKYGRV